MTERERVAALLLVLVLCSIIGLGVWLTLSERPNVARRPKIEVGIKTLLQQVDRTTGHVLWAVRAGTIQREVGAEQAVVREVTCALYAGGKAQFVARAPLLNVDGERGVLSFVNGVSARSAEGVEPKFSATAWALTYIVDEKRAELSGGVQFSRGPAQISGATLVAQFDERGLADCVVTEMPNSAGKRVAIAVFLLSAVAAAQQQKQLETPSASVYAPRLSWNVAEHTVKFTGQPELVVGDTHITAPTIEVLLNEDDTDVVKATATGGVQLTTAWQGAGESEPKRRIVATAPTAVFVAEGRQVRLERGVEATISGGQEGEKPSVLAAPRLVAWLEEKVIVAEGGVSFEFGPAEGKRATLRCQRVTYRYGKERSVEATGAPTLTSSDYVISGGKIVAQLEAQRSAVKQAEVIGGVEVRTKGKNGRPALGKAGRATYVAQGEVLTLLDNPTVTFLPRSKDEKQAVLRAEKIVYRGAEDVIVAEGQPTLTSEDGFSFSCQRIVAHSDPETGALARAEGLGGVTLRATIGSEGNKRAARATAGRCEYDAEKRTAALKEGPRVVLARRQGSETVLTAQVITYEIDKRRYTASGRPRLVQGDTTVSAKVITATLDPESGELKAGHAEEVVVLAVTETKEKKKRRIDGSAQRADFVPDVRDPLDQTKRCGKITFTGSPQLRLSDAQTGRVLAQYTNIRVIDLYLRDEGLLVEAYNPGQRTTLTLQSAEEG